MATTPIGGSMGKFLMKVFVAYLILRAIGMIAAANYTPIQVPAADYTPIPYETPTQTP
jgi:hypothetical protein